MTLKIYLLLLITVFRTIAHCQAENNTLFFNSDSTIKDGKFICFSENGKKSVQGEYNKNKPVGTWTIWDKSEKDSSVYFYNENGERETIKLSDYKENNSYNHVFNNYYNEYHPFGFIMSLNLNYLRFNFNKYKNLLGERNVSFLNGHNVILQGEFSGMWNRYYFGFTLGGNSIDNHYIKKDSIKIEANTTQFELHFGYNIIDSWRFLISPNLSISNYKTRLINSIDVNYKIPIGQYLKQRELDLRFNQLVLIAGIDFYYLFPIFGSDKDFWGIGFYFGYPINILNETQIHSKTSRLLADEKINVGKISFGLKLSAGINDN